MQLCIIRISRTNSPSPGAFTNHLCTRKRRLRLHSTCCSRSTVWNRSIAARLSRECSPCPGNPACLGSPSAGKRVEGSPSMGRMDRRGRTVEELGSSYRSIGYHRKRCPRTVGALHKCSRQTGLRTRRLLIRNRGKRRRGAPLVQQLGVETWCQ